MWESVCTQKLFSLLTAWPTVFLALGCLSYFISPAFLPLLSAVNNQQQHLSWLKMNMEAKSWHSLCHEIKVLQILSFRNQYVPDDAVQYQSLGSSSPSPLPEEQELHSPASKVGQALFPWEPLRCFVICRCAQGDFWPAQAVGVTSCSREPREREPWGWSGIRSPVFLLSVLTSVCWLAPN